MHITINPSVHCYNLYFWHFRQFSHKYYAFFSQNKPYFNLSSHYCSDAAILLVPLQFRGKPNPSSYRPESGKKKLCLFCSLLDFYHLALLNSQMHLVGTSRGGLYWTKKVLQQHSFLHSAKCYWHTFQWRVSPTWESILHGNGDPLIRCVWWGCAWGCCPCCIKHSESHLHIPFTQKTALCCQVERCYASLRCPMSIWISPP